MHLMIKDVHGINDNDEQFILAYADDIAQTATTKEDIKVYEHLECSFYKVSTQTQSYEN